MKRVLTAAFAVGVIGCSNVKVELQKIEPGDVCANGGVKVFVVGQDPQVICNGANGTNGTNGSNGTNGTNGTNGSNGANGDAGTNGNNGSNGATSIVQQNPIAVGDPRCARGGVEVLSGLDSGGDGGIAGDGALQPGEVTASTVVCAGFDGARVGSTTPPTGAAGTATIKSNGGASTVTDGGYSYGGNGGQIEVGMNNGTNGGHVKLWRTGLADATFTVPTAPAGDFGANPLNVTTDTDVPYIADFSTLDAGTLFSDGSQLYFAAGGSANPNRVTGLTVAAGATLTLPFTNSPHSIERSCRINGTLRGEDSAQSNGNGSLLGLSCGDLVLASTSRVDALGTASKPTISTHFSSNFGSLQALGTIDTSGFDGGVGNYAANGGTIQIRAFGAEAYVGGTLRANGGDSIDTSGTGGSINLEGRTGLFTSASIETNGGNAVASGNYGRGGSGGSVNLNVYDTMGVVKNSGAITTKGGTVSGTNCTNCWGGNGGTVWIESRLGALSNQATVTATGGRGVQGGGSGGNLNVLLGRYWGDIGLGGSLHFSGSVDVSGADGELGGGGGDVNLNLGYGASIGAEVVLLGYSGIEAMGGDGNEGGRGGELDVYQRATSSDGTVLAPGGAILNTLDVRVQGGNGSIGYGGSGGEVYFSGQNQQNANGAAWEVVSNTGAIFASGGRGVHGGGAGDVEFSGPIALLNAGAIDVRGGVASSGDGGGGGEFSMRSNTAVVECSGAVDVSGGAGGTTAQAQGGSGGDIPFEGSSVRVSAVLNAKGGSGDTTAGVGGHGGRVWLHSFAGTSQQSVAAPGGIVVSGGAANVAGVSGLVMFDGFLVTSQWTH